MTKAVAKKETTAVSTGYDYGEEAGVGFENTDKSDLSIPFLAVLQSNSPQVVDEDPEEASPGMLFNTVTRELVDGSEGIVFLPVHKEIAFAEWIPREKGGGFVGLHQPKDEIVLKTIEDNGGVRTGKLELENGNELVETHYVYGLMLDEEGADTTGFGVISCTSTKIKPCRDWNTAMFTLKGRPPMFANRARVRTVKQKNEKGTFYNFRFEPLKDTWLGSLINPKTEGHLLEAARDFREMVTSGEARAAHETERAASGTGGGDDEEAPF